MELERTVVVSSRFAPKSFSKSFQCGHSQNESTPKKHISFREYRRFTPNTAAFRLWLFPQFVPNKTTNTKYQIDQNQPIYNDHNNDHNDNNNNDHNNNNRQSIKSFAHSLDRIVKKSLRINPSPTSSKSTVIFIAAAFSFKLEPNALRTQLSESPL